MAPMCQLRATPSLKALKVHPELLNSHPNYEVCCLPITGERIKVNIVLSPQNLLSEPFSNQGPMGGQFSASSNFILKMIPHSSFSSWTPVRP